MSSPISTDLIPYTPPQTPLQFIHSEIRRIQSEKKTSLSLSSNLLSHIFSYLKMRGLIRCSLVNRQWKLVYGDRTLWKLIKTDMSNEKFFDVAFMEMARKYKNIFSKFSASRFGCVMHAYEKRFGSVKGGLSNCEKLSTEMSAYAIRDLCQAACDSKDYQIAMNCHWFAKQYLADAGNEAMSYIIISQVSDQNFLEKSNDLIQLSKDLINDDLEFGLKALMAVACKFADLKMFREAIKNTQFAQTLRDTKTCQRKRDFSLDIQPFMAMGKHALSMNNYDLAEYCARKLDKRSFNPQLFYADIIIKQIQENNSINKTLFSEITPQTPAWKKAIEGLVAGLNKHKRFDEAKKIGRTGKVE